MGYLAMAVKCIAVSLLLLCATSVGSAASDAISMSIKSVTFADNGGRFQLEVRGHDKWGNVDIIPLVAPKLGVSSTMKLVDGDVLDCTVKGDKIVCHRI